MSTLKFNELAQNLKDLKQFCYKNLAVRITKIEDYLSTLTDRIVEGSVIVNGAFKSEVISPLNISESQLIQIYNDVPKVLLKNSIVVELTAKSYRDIEDGKLIFLENDENGKYWIITTGIDKFFLVPSVNIKLNIHKLKTVEKLFDFCGDSSSADSHFMLTKPAKVSSNSSGREWKLEERGVLEFKNTILQSLLQLEDEVIAFPNVITQFLQQLQDLDTRLKKLEMSSLNHSPVTYTTANNQSSHPPANTLINYPEPQLENISYSQTSASHIINQIVSAYNSKPRSLYANAITVAENDSTVEERRIGRTVSPILEENLRGNYWIIKEGDNQYLVPKVNIKINKYNYDIISSCFECLGYNPGNSNNFKLLKPATVSSIGQHWQLIEQGKLQF